MRRQDPLCQAVSLTENVQAALIRHLKIGDLDRMTPCFWADPAAELKDPEQPVVPDDFFPIDNQKGAVVGDHRERVIARLLDVQVSFEKQGEIVLPLARGLERQVENMTRLYGRQALQVRESQPAAFEVGIIQAVLFGIDPAE